MCKLHWKSGTMAKRAALVTDAALAAEREATAEQVRLAEASAAMFKKIEPPRDVLQLAGLQAHAGYLIDKHVEDSRSSRPWEEHGLTIDLATACAYAEQDNYRVRLVKAYRLTDGSLITSPKLWRVKEL